MRIKCEVRRTGNASQALATANARIAARVEHGLRAAGSLLFDESQKLVPTDLEALKESGGIRQEGHGFDTVVIVGYGRPGFARMGPSRKEKVYDRKTRTYTSTPKVVLHVPANYAVIVHERLDLHHETGQAKFLETPLYEKRAEMIEAFWVAARL